MSKNDSLPTLLVIASTRDEDWVNICSKYSSKFRVIQATWDEIFLTSYSDQKFPVVEIHPSNSKGIISNISPSLVLVRNLARYISSKLETVSDFRNILYGFYHSNVPMLNNLEALMAELEKPIMYGRLRKIRDIYGEEKFPLITQYYYPNPFGICITPDAPYVVKVSYPHAGFGKIRVKDYHEIDDIRSILALHKDYVSIEPLIDVDYELRIVFIAPNYYRVHKRRGMNWKVNYGNTNIREECEMKPNWKLWIDLIYKHYPDMLIFDIDAIVDKKGKEYILEVNGSSQGFVPETVEQDIEHLKNLVLRKMETIIGEELLEEGNDAKSLFKEKKEIKIINEEIDKETQIINLKNIVNEYKSKLLASENKYNELVFENNNNNRFKKKNLPLLIAISILILAFLFVKIKLL